MRNHIIIQVVLMKVTIPFIMITIIMIIMLMLDKKWFWVIGHMLVPPNMGKKAIVIGDSHLRRINWKLFNESLPYCKENIKFFSGAKSVELEHYIKPMLINNKPDIVVIHIGTNDIDFRNVDNGAIVNNTAENIINIANLCKEYGINEIVISSILPKKNMKLSKYIREVNHVLCDLFKINNIYFLAHDNIGRNFICDIHTNKDGTYLLASNFVNFINIFGFN